MHQHGVCVVCVCVQKISYIGSRTPELHPMLWARRLAAPQPAARCTVHGVRPLELLSRPPHEPIPGGVLRVRGTPLPSNIVQAVPHAVLRPMVRPLVAPQLRRRAGATITQTPGLCEVGGDILV